MKNIAKLLAAIMIISLFAAVFTAAPAALDSGDWKVVNAPTGTPQGVLLETTANNGIRLGHEGHYPSSNAGLLYTQPLDIRDGIKLNVTLELCDEDSPDVWHGIFLMNRPVYFDVNNYDPEEGFGIVLLTRPGGNFLWFTVSEAGFTQAVACTGSDYVDGKDYYEPGVTIDYEIKMVGKELHILVDGVDTDYDFSDFLLPYLTDNQAYIGYSTSETNLSYQSFVINYLNEQQPASEGDAITRAEGAGPKETEEDPNAIDFETVDSFTLIDFTNPDTLNAIKNTNDCRISYDETDGALKIEVTGQDPYINIPMKKNMYFPGDDFFILKMEYKTDEDGECTFYYTTKEVPDMAYCNLGEDLAPTDGEYKVFECDMQESSNWYGEIRNFRFDPAASGAEGQVYYVKSIGFERYVAPETTTAAEAEPITTDTETDTTADTTTTSADTESTAAAPTTTDGSGSTQTKSGTVPAFVWIIIGVAAAAVIAVIVVMVLKKKKK